MHQLGDQRWIMGKVGVQVVDLAGAAARLAHQAGEIDGLHKAHIARAGRIALVKFRVAHDMPERPQIA